MCSVAGNNGIRPAYVLIAYACCEHVRECGFMHTTHTLIVCCVFFVSPSQPASKLKHTLLLNMHTKHNRHGISHTPCEHNWRTFARENTDTAQQENQCGEKPNKTPDEGDSNQLLAARLQRGRSFVAFFIPHSARHSSEMPAYKAPV